MADKDAPETEAVRAGQRLASSAVAQVGRGRAAVMSGLPIFAGRPYICGPAVTCACAPEDNLALHIALFLAPPGAVIVCDGGGTCHSGLLGELMVTDAAARGLAGIVVSGTVRDRDDLDRIGFPVLAAGTAPAQAAKLTAVSVGQPVVAGGVLVMPGDQIIADRDGAAVVPAAEWDAVRVEAAGLAAREAVVRHRLAAGERLADIIGLDLSGYSPLVGDQPGHPVTGAPRQAPGASGRPAGRTGMNPLGREGQMMRLAAECGGGEMVNDD